MDFKRNPVEKAIEGRLWLATNQRLYGIGTLSILAADTLRGCSDALSRLHHELKKLPHGEQAPARAAIAAALREHSQAVISAIESP